MSFIRPELRARLPGMAEPAVLLLAGLLGAWMLWRGLADLAWLLIALGLPLLAGAMALGLAWYRRQRFVRNPDAAGMVEVTEAQIAYFAPEGGAIVDLDALLRVAVAGAPPVWMLIHEGGLPVSIPFAAKGADRLLDALIALPGLDEEGALRAAEAPGAGAPVTVWRRALPGRG